MLLTNWWAMPVLATPWERDIFILPCTCLSSGNREKESLAKIWKKYRVVNLEKDLLQVF
jgi:hypothetical protein